MTEGTNITETLYNLSAGQAGGSFVYCSDNPVRFIDFMGMGPEDPPHATTHLYVKPQVPEEEQNS